MHILFIVENLPVPFDRRVWSEALALREAGHEVTVICPGVSTGLSSEEVLEGVRVLRHPLREAQRGIWQYIREYAQALFWETRLAWFVWRGSKFDAIHICNPPDLLFMVAWPFKVLFGVKVVFDHHDLTPELYTIKFNRRGIGYLMMRAAEFLTLRSASHVISTNESYAAIAKTRGGRSDDEVTIVRSGPDLKRFQRIEVENRSVGVVLGYVGVMAEQDGVELLVAAMHEIIVERGRTDISLTLIGDGPLKSDLELRVKEFGLAQYVDFLGFLSGEDLLRAMSRMDIGVCPDPFNDYNDKCTMNKILEYMALSIPVVQFDLKEGRVSAGPASLYAGKANDPTRLADAIIVLADDEEKRIAMGKLGRERMEKSLEWRHQVPKLLGVYRSWGS